MTTPALESHPKGVVFDSATTLERVRIKMRRARERLVKSLPGLGETSGSNPSKS